MEIGKESLLYSECSRWDYVDRYRFAVADPGDRIGLSDLAEAFVGPGPRWVEGLFALRNRIVSVFGFENCGGTWGLSGAAENGSRKNGPNIRDVRPVRRMRSCSATTIGISNRVIGFRCSVGRATCFYWKFVRRFFDRARYRLRRKSL